MTTAFGIERSPESETIAAAVVAAAQAAAGLLPAAAPLTAGQP
ncbi:MAG: Flagellar motor switch protein FliN/FliY, partial [Modestobacter sp.]|nr:Flagellar motor switch protein FliN/FliY [Modestobacter sp.]